MTTTITTTPSAKNAVLTPPLDIYELNGVVCVIAELPGVDNDNLNIQVHDKTLSIEGVLSIATADGEQEGHEEVTSPYYVRTLQMSGDLDTDNIDANFKDGILRLKISKKAESKPRKIEIKFT